MLFLRTNSLEVKRLAVRDRDFAMVWVAAVYWEVLVCVCGLDMQVSTNLAIFQSMMTVVTGFLL